MKKTKYNNKGFSLVELIIAVAILAIAIVPLVANFVSSSKVNMKSKRILSGTEMTQNMMEGIAAKDPHEMIKELSYGDPAHLSFLPTGVTVGGVGECSVEYESTPPAGSTIPKAKRDAKGNYILHVEATNNSYIENADTPSGKLIGDFKNDLNGVYSFWLRDVFQNGTYYDMKLTFDAQAYDTYNKEAPIDITSANVAYDAIYRDVSSNLENTITSVYSSRVQSAYYNAIDYSLILSKLRRIFVIDIEENVGSIDTTYKVSVTTNYEYTNASELRAGAVAEYSDTTFEIFDSSVYGKKPRNIYIYYTPNYRSMNSGAGILDQFVVNNLNDVPVKVIFIREKQIDPNPCMVSSNKTDAAKETNYAVSLNVNESSLPASGGDYAATSIASNFEQNIAYEYDTTDYNKVSTTTEYAINNSIMPIDGESIKHYLKAVSLEGKTDGDYLTDKEKIYDVTLEVYSGKVESGTKNKSGYSPNDGAFANHFPDNRRIANFTGSARR